MNNCQRCFLFILLTLFLWNKDQYWRTDNVPDRNLNSSCSQKRTLCIFHLQLKMKNQLEIIEIHWYLKNYDICCFISLNSGNELMRFVDGTTLNIIRWRLNMNEYVLITSMTILYVNSFNLDMLRRISLSISFLSTLVKWKSNDYRTNKDNSSRYIIQQRNRTLKSSIS